MTYISSSGQRFRVDGPHRGVNTSTLQIVLLGLALLICIGGSLLGVRMMRTGLTYSARVPAQPRYAPLETLTSAAASASNSTAT